MYCMQVLLLYARKTDERSFCRLVADWLMDVYVVTAPSDDARDNHVTGRQQVNTAAPSPSLSLSHNVWSGRECGVTDPGLRL